MTQRILDNLATIIHAPNGIKYLREMILQLAVQGKLVPQDENDEPASVLLAKIQAEKECLIQEGKIKRQKPLPSITEEEKPFELPKGWEWVRLGILGDWGAGATPLRSKPEYYGGSIPWFKSGELTADYISKSEETVTDLALKECSLRQNQKGDVLIAMYGATIGKTAILEIEATTNQAVCACTPFSTSITQYLLLLLKAYKPHFIRMGAGGAQPNISREKIIATVTCLPPEKEIPRIIAKVDSLLSLCDQLEALQTQRTQLNHSTRQAVLDQLSNAQSPLDLQTAWQRLQTHLPQLFTEPQHIKGLRDAILQLAVQGKLVPQDENDEPASVLLAKIQAEKERLIQEGKIKRQKPLPAITEEEKPFELPKGWEWVRLSEFTLVGTGSTPPRENPGYYNPPEFNWVTSGETSQAHISFTKEKVSRKALSETNISIYPVGSLIVAMYGQGKTRGQVSELLIEAGTNQACAAIQFLETHEAHRKYIKLFFKKSYEDLRNQAAGGAQPNLNVAKISMTVIPLPPLAEKIRLVHKTESLLNLCDQLESKLTQARQTQEQLALTTTTMN